MATTPASVDKHPLPSIFVVTPSMHGSALFSGRTPGLVVSGWLGGEMVYVHKGGGRSGRNPLGFTTQQASGLTSRVAIPEIATRRLFRALYSEATWVGTTVFTGADVSMVWVATARRPWIGGSQVLKTDHANMRILRATM
jgi:hypothetical protein